MPVNPITPSEASKTKASTIPDFVFEAFNHLIAAKFNGRSATVQQDEVVGEIMERGNVFNHVERQEIFDKHWLDVEDVYIAAGWSVEYDKYANGGARFTFEIKVKRS